MWSETVWVKCDICGEDMEVQTPYPNLASDGGWYHDECAADVLGE